MVRVTGTVNCSGGRRPSHVKVRVTGQLAPAWRRRGPRNHSSFSRAAGPHVLYELLLLPGPGPGHGHRAVMDAMPGQPETNPALPGRAAALEPRAGPRAARPAAAAGSQAEGSHRGGATDCQGSHGAPDGRRACRVTVAAFKFRLGSAPARRQARRSEPPP